MPSRDDRLTAEALRRMGDSYERQGAEDDLHLRLYELADEVEAERIPVWVFVVSAAAVAFIIGGVVL